MEDIVMNKDIDITDIISENYKNYAKTLIQGRSFPELYDGLIPVQRRILFGMGELGLTSKARFMKSARIVGDVMGKYHPHGDSSIYESMVKLGLEWSTNVPFTDIKGNKGSVDGDNPAAMRYTEAKLTKEAEYLISGVKKGDLVEWGNNYDDSLKEPLYLPAQYPNVLVNGGGNMAIGFRSSNLPHNITESIESCIQLLEDPNLTFKDLAIKGPDFPGGGKIVNGKDLERMYELGEGRVKVRSRYKMEYRKEKKKKLRSLVFTDLLYGVNKAKIVDVVRVMIDEKKINGVIDIRDESGSDGIRICVDISEGVKPEVIAEILYKKTDLESTYSYNSLMTIGGNPVYNIKLVDILKEFNVFRITTVYKEIKYDLEKLKIKIGRLDALNIIYPHLDEVVALIKGSDNKELAKDKLVSKYGLEDYQAEYILSIPLSRLTKDNREVNREKIEQLTGEYEELSSKLESKESLKAEVINRYKDVIEDIGKDRNTDIIDEAKDIEIEESKLIKLEDTVVGVNKNGNVKRSNKRSYSLSDKNADDFVVETNTHSKVVIFTNKGRYTYLPVSKIDEVKWSEVSNNLLEITKDFLMDEEVIKVVEYNDKLNYISITKEGYIKKGKLSDLEVSRYGSQYTYMGIKDENDYVLSVGVIDKDIYMVAESENKSGVIYALPFNTSQLDVTGKNAKGRRVTSKTKTREFVRLVNIEEVEECELGKTSYKDLEYDYKYDHDFGINAEEVIGNEDAVSEEGVVHEGGNVTTDENEVDILEEQDI